MTTTISKRGKIRIALYIFALIVALLITAVIGSITTHNLERQVLLSQQRALTELDTYLGNMSVSLCKGIYVSTPPMMNTVATELWRQASGAKGSLSVLPTSNAEIEAIYKFLSQVGDFVMSLNRKVAMGEKITAEERENLNSFIEISKNLEKQISAVREDMLRNNYRFEETKSTLISSGIENQLFSDDIKNAEQSITEYPSLIYDGPFSDHINKMSPKMLENAEMISKEQALKVASKFSGVAEKDLSLTAEECDNTESYCFSAKNINIAVTKKGGYVLYMLRSEFAGEQKLSYEEALKIASDFLVANECINMKESYYAINDGICTINFAYVENDTICYPDLIKVEVNMENGKIMGYDARGYIVNHTKRSIAPAKITEETAGKSVSSQLTIMSSKKAVIPTKSHSEQSTYEFHCKDENGQEVLVYIDQTTGYEDNILLLLYSDNGILTK
ncbi:MAG: germination protein YpeB [Oscillospiraceae bacterium]